MQELQGRVQAVLPARAFEWLWRARVRAMLRRRQRHVCKLQTVSAIMVLAPDCRIWDQRQSAT